MSRATESLPWAWYAEPGIHRLEQDRIFARSWQYVGHVGQVERPGDVFPCMVGRVPVVVTRGEDGALHALANVCRHRGSVIVEEPGNRRSLQCPYHAWTYRLDGTLRAAPRSEREPAFVASELSLASLRLESWGPFLFVNPGPGAEPLASVLEDLPDLVAAAGVDVFCLRFHHRVEWEVEANWKLVCENFLECYHCPVAHAGFSALVDVSPDSYRLETGRWSSSQFGALRPGARAAYDAGGEVTRGQFHFLWPNTTVNLFPGRPNLSIGAIAPAGPERARRTLDYFFAADADDAWIRELLAFDDQIGREDDALVRRAQRGVASGALERGRLLTGSEPLIVHFQELVRASLAGSPLAPDGPTASASASASDT